MNRGRSIKKPDDEMLSGPPAAGKERPIYPARPQFYALRFGRLVQKSCLANQIGPAATLLLITVALTEDASHYRRGVTFWDGQIMPIIGLSSWRSLDRARKAAVNAGWLHYEPGGKSKAAVYWTIIPGSAEGIDDAPTDEGGHTDLHLRSAGESAGEKSNGTELHLRSAGDEANGAQAITQTKSSPFKPVPNPVPLPKDILSVETEIISVWNACDGVRKNRGDGLTAKRRTALRARLADRSWDWRAACAKFPLRCTLADPNSWRPDLDWFLKSDSVTKILEGTYDWIKSSGTPPGSGAGPNLTEDILKDDARLMAHLESLSSLNLYGLTNSEADRLTFFALSDWALAEGAPPPKLFIGMLKQLDRTIPERYDQSGHHRMNAYLSKKRQAAGNQSNGSLGQAAIKMVVDNLRNVTAVPEDLGP